MDPVRTLERRGRQGGDLPSQETDDLLKQIINSLHTLDYCAYIYLCTISTLHIFLRSWTHIPHPTYIRGPADPGIGVRL